MFTENQDDTVMCNALVKIKQALLDNLPL